MAALVDLTGKKFGSWEVLSRVVNDRHGHVRWLCRCSCGDEKVVLGADLRSGRSTQCKACAGHEFIDLTGKKFGSWEVLSRAEGFTGKARWLCRCACGSESVVPGFNLRRGTSTQCMACACEKLRLPDDQLGYGLVHYRLRALRGPAGENLCACGEPALEWAYQHCAGDSERWGLHGASTVLMPYSTDLSHYAPMCSSCHVKLDQQKAKDRKASVS